MTRSTSIARFTSLRAALETERAALIQRLQEIESALGASGPAASIPAPGASRLTMREAIAEVVKDSPKRVRDIVAGMQALGYPFTSKDPYNSVGAFLYGAGGRKSFKSVGGLFSLRRPGK